MTSPTQIVNPAQLITLPLEMRREILYNLSIRDLISMSEKNEEMASSIDWRFIFIRNFGEASLSLIKSKLPELNDMALTDRVDKFILFLINSDALKTRFEIRGVRRIPTSIMTDGSGRFMVETFTHGTGVKGERYTLSQVTPIILDMFINGDINQVWVSLYQAVPSSSIDLKFRYAARLMVTLMSLVGRHVRIERHGDINWSNTEGRYTGIDLTEIPR